MTSKYRRKIFNKGLGTYLYKLLKGVESYYPEIEIIEYNYDDDHIHILASIPPKMSVGSVIRILKSNTSRGLKREFKFLKEVYWGTDGIWSAGYFVSTVGASEKVIKNYIEHQGKEDSAQAELDLG
jgi:putative transposase